MAYVIIPTALYNAGYLLSYGDGSGGWIPWDSTSAKQIDANIPLKINRKDGGVLNVVNVIKYNTTTKIGTFSYDPSDVGLVGVWNSAGITGNIAFVITTVPSYDDTPPPIPDFVVTQDLLDFKSGDINVYINGSSAFTLGREFDFPVEISFRLTNADNEFKTYPPEYTRPFPSKIARTYNETVDVSDIVFTYGLVVEPEPEPPTSYTVTSTLKYELSNVFCGGKINGVAVKSGDVYDYPFTLALTPLSLDYQFTDGTRLKEYVYNDGLIVVSELDLLQEKIPEPEPEPDPDFIMNQGFLNTLNPSDAVVTIAGVTPYLGMVVKQFDEFKVVANDGRKFYDVPNSTASVYIIPPAGNPYSFEFDDDYKTATWDFTIYRDFYGVPEPYYRLFIQTVADVDDDVANVNDVWLLDPELLPSITQYNFKGSNGSTSESYSSFFIGLIELPFKIDTGLISDRKNIYLGSLDTEITSDSLSVDTLHIDMGEINVVGTGSFLDYKNVNVVLHLPYSKSIMLTPDYVIDQTIKIEYVINLYNGDLMINVWSSKIDAVIITEHVNMNISVPFGGVDTFPRNNDPRDIELGGDNGITTPFIELMKSEAILSDGVYTIPVTDENVLTDEKGYIRVENIDIVSKANSYEKDLIVQQLQTGVIIK